MAQKISVVIPNFNGYDLLAKNLPSILKHCPNCQIVVVDDASTDDSVNFINKNFKKIKLIQLPKNKGFAHAANIGVKAADGNLVLLLNSDVVPRVNFLKTALPHFDDDKVFSVGLADLSHEKGKIVTRGRGGGVFERGFLKHFALTAESGETLWVSGGSGVFDKKKFLELGGFDEHFAPFYWEDIDLSFRAWKKGYLCLFEPNSKVNHFHQEGAIKKSKSDFYIRSVSYKNQFLFVWKNIPDPFWLIQHLAWFPYHFAKAVITFDLAFFTGFLWALSQIPQLVLNYPNTELSNYQLTDREVLGKFAKP